MTLLLGPSGGTIKDILTTGQNLAYGDTDAAGKHALKLLPFQMWKQIGQQLID